VVTYSGGSTYHPGRLPSHASLAQLPTAPEATPPPNHTWRSYYHAAGRRVAMRVQEGTTGANQAHYLFADHPSACSGQASVPATSAIAATAGRP